MRLVALTAIFLAAIAFADVPPPPPDDPLGPDCQPFIGVWAQTTPDISRGGASWRVIAVGSEKAAVTKYVNLQDVNVIVESHDTALVCEATADGVTVLNFKGRNDTFALTARLTDEASFSTERTATYNEPGPPPPDWKGETVVTNWVRIAR